MYFPYLVIISPWKRAWPFIWTNLNPLHSRMLCAKFGSGSGEEDKNVKSLRQQQQLRKNFDQNLQLRWANKDHILIVGKPCWSSEGVKRYWACRQQLVYRLTVAKLYAHLENGGILFCYILTLCSVKDN